MSIKQRTNCTPSPHNKRLAWSFFTQCVCLFMLIAMPPSLFAKQLGNAQNTAPLLVKKHVVTMANFSTFGGKVIDEINVGWEAYGNLNENKDNVILITHYFSGSSHAVPVALPDLFFNNLRAHT